MQYHWFRLETLANDSLRTSLPFWDVEGVGFERTVPQPRRCVPSGTWVRGFGSDVSGLLPEEPY